MDNVTLANVIRILVKVIPQWQEPIIERIATAKHDPYRILISTLLSLRTKDATTDGAAQRLFSIADTPYSMVQTPVKEIERAIYPVGFYRTKALNIVNISSLLLEKYGGNVPGTLEDLLSIPGIGRKTANLVLILGFDKMGICVDTHVHRITNRWGYVATKTPDETEVALRKKLPKKYWKGINNILVTYGQNLCLPVSPYCSKCLITQYCRKLGVKKSR